METCQRAPRTLRWAGPGRFSQLCVGKTTWKTIDRRPGDCFEKHSHHSHPSPTLPVDSSLQVYRHPPYTVYPQHHQCLCSNCWESERQVRKGLRCYPSIRWITGKIIPDQGTSAINSFVEITPIFDGSAKNIWGVLEMDPPKLLLLNEETPILVNPHILWVPLKTCSTKKFLAQRVHRTSSNGTRKRKEPSELLASPMEIYEIPPPETLILYWFGSCRRPRGQVPVNGSPWGWFPRFQPPKGMTVARINCIEVGARSVGLTSDSWSHLKNGLSNSHIHSHTSNIHV